MNSFTNLAKGCEVWVYNSNSKLYLLGNNIVFNLSKALNTPNRGIKTSKSFYVLKHTKMPALLIEIDFISNPVVESVCLSDDYIKTTSYTIASTLLAFVNKKL